MMRASFYAVARGRNAGVFRTWQQCRSSVEGYSGAVFKKFPTHAEAAEFVRHNGDAIKSALKVRHPPPRKSDDGESGSGSGMAAAIVYTDGACAGNGTKGAKAGYGVFWGSEQHPDNVSAPVPGVATNNRAEYFAVIAALEKALERRIPQLVIRTDSNLLIQSMTKWLHKWRKNGWKTLNGSDVRNRDLLERISELMSSSEVKVQFEKVKGHSGDYGNDQADLLARRGAEQYNNNDNKNVGQKRAFL